MSALVPDTGEAPTMSQQAIGSWYILRLQITPSNCLIAIPNFEFENWLVEDKYAILGAFSNMTGAHGIFVRDYAQPRTFLGPVEFFNSQNVLYTNGHVSLLLPPLTNDPTPISPGRPSFFGDGIMFDEFAPNNDRETEPMSETASIEKIPRPPNAFILYRKHHHASVVAQNPGVHNNKISQIIGKMWGEESEVVTANFKAQADRAKSDHTLKFPNYQYQPRKPSEKKRRMTKKKAATLAANAIQTSSKFSSPDPLQSSLPNTNKTKNCVVKKTKRTNTITTMAPQGVGRHYDIADNVWLVDDLAANSFEFTDINEFVNHAEGIVSTEHGAYSEKNNVFFNTPSNDTLQPDVMEGCQMFARSQGWYM